MAVAVGDAFVFEDDGGEDVSVGTVERIFHRTWKPRKGQVHSVQTTARLPYRRNRTVPLVLVHTPRGWRNMLSKGQTYKHVPLKKN